MACFDDIIAIHELCTEVVPQTFYLNDIGINAAEIGDYITSEYSGVQDFITKKSQYAIRQVQGDVYAHLLPYYKASSILASSRIGSEASTRTLVAQTGMVGIEVKIYNPVSFVDFNLSDVSLFTDFTGDIDVLIYDVLQGKLLDTITVPVIAGEISTLYQTVTVPAPRKALHLWIGYDTAGGTISSYKTTANSGCTSCSGFTFSNRFIHASGAQIAAPYIASSIDALTHTGGLSFNYSVACNHYDWLCNHRAVLGPVFLYRTGIEIIKHAKIAAITQRTMNITTVSKEVLEEKYNFYATEYNNALNNILKNMRVPSDINCFHCNRPVKSYTTLP